MAPLALVVPLAILVAARTNTGHTPQVEIRLLESAAPACSNAGLARDLQARVLRKGETVACGDFERMGLAFFRSQPVSLTLTSRFLVRNSCRRLAKRIGLPVHSQVVRPRRPSVAGC